MMKNAESYKLKQHDITILLFIYRFRFLTTYQIQQLLLHQYPSRVILWLTNLVENKYLKKYDNPKDVTTPTTYSLGTKARKYFKEEYNGDDVKISRLDRVWHEHTYSDQFRNTCVFTAFLYLSLVALTKKTKATVRFHTKTDLHGTKFFIKPLPDAFFAITESSGTTKRYFVDIFSYYPPPKELIKRVSTYFSYYKRGIWQDRNKNPFPNIVFVTSENITKNILTKRIKKYLSDELPLNFYLANWRDIQTNGISKQVLHKVVL